MADYCAVSDVYRWIPPGSVPTPARLVSSVATSTEVLSLDGHGFADDAELVFRADAGGSLPWPLVAGTTYYAIELTDSTFSVASAAGGSAINLTTVGENVLVIGELPWSSWITWASSRIEDALTGHAVPLDGPPYPPTVVEYTAGLTAEQALAFGGVGTELIAKRLDRVRADFDRWRKGATIRGTNAPSASNLAIRSTVTSSDPRGWASRGNGVLP